MSAAQTAAAAAARLRGQQGWQGPPLAARRPALIVLSGLPGTGKSYVAAAIAQRHPVAVVRSDEVRKALYAHPSYAPGENGFVYLTCYALLETMLADGYAVVFDATNLTRAGRKRLHQIAARAGAPRLVLVTTAPESVVADRLARRAAGELERYSSDADWVVHQKLASTAEPPGEAGLEVDTSAGIEPALQAVARLLGRATRRRHRTAGRAAWAAS